MMPPIIQYPPRERPAKPCSSFIARMVRRRCGKVLASTREANFWGSALLALCVEANSRIPAGANSRPLSGSITLRRCVAKSYSTMRQSVA